MMLAWLLLLTGLIISAVAIYYSVVGLAAIFSAAIIPIIVMGTTLEVAKLVCASWLKDNWERVPILMKIYMTTAVIVLMIITSMGIFGFLSKAHSDQSLVSGDVQSKIAVYDEKIRTERENIEASRNALKQMDATIDETIARSKTDQGAINANAMRQRQAKERRQIQTDIAASQKLIASLNEQRAPIAAEVRKVEAEVGPIKYIAAFVYGDNPDANILEKAVTWVIIIIVAVFDPLAIIMLLAAQMSFGWRRESKIVAAVIPSYEPDNGPLTEEQLDQIKESAKVEPFYAPWPATSKITEPNIIKSSNEEFEKDIQQTDIQQYPVEQDYSSIEAANKQLEEEMHQSRLTADTTEVTVDKPTLPESEEELKKKELHDQTRGNADSEDQGLNTYVQNEEQDDKTLWQRLKKPVQLGPKDRLYKEYSDHQFKHIVVDEILEPELFAFVKETQNIGPKFSDYEYDNLEYFARRIYELRKN